MSKALVKAVADLPSADAVVRLSEYAAREPAGLRRRALLAARIAVMRRALDAPDPVMVVVPPPPAPAPEPEPEPVIAPVVKAPKPLSKGVMMSINLDDVARMLSAQEEAPAPPPAAALEPAPAPEAAPEVLPPDQAATFAALDWEDTAARLDPGEVPGMASADPGADWDQWAPMADGAKAVAVPAQEAPAVAAASAPVKAPAKRGKAQGVLADPGAAFAALMTGEEPAAAPEVAPAPPAAEPKPGAAAPDPAAAFAALAAPGPASGPSAPAKAPAKRGKAQGMLADPGAAFAALMTGEEPVTGPAAAPGKAKGAGVDLSAKFAAMDGLGDGPDGGR